MADNRYIPSDSASDVVDSSVRSENSIFDVGVFTVDFSKGLKKFWYIVLIFAVVFGFSSGYLRHSSYQPMYRSSVSFSVSALSYNTAGNTVFVGKNVESAKITASSNITINGNVINSTIIAGESDINRKKYQVFRGRFLIFFLLFLVFF